MNRNEFRASFGGGSTVLNGWLTIPSLYTAEMMTHVGWQALTLDMQHGPIGYSDALAMLTAISTRRVLPIVRVRSLDDGLIMQALDSGARGVIAPMVNSRADVERLVSAARYAPLGQRSFGPGRASLAADEAYTPEYANRAVFVLAMIETREALANLDAILDTPGLDGVYVGPSDLSLALGYKPGLDRTEEEMVAAIATIRRATLDRNQIAAIHTGAPAFARRMADEEFDMVTIGSDAKLMEVAARQACAAFCDNGGAPAAPRAY